MSPSDSHSGSVPHPEGHPLPAPFDADPSHLVRSLCRQLPEFVPTYLALVDGCGDDPGEPLVLMELAEFVSHRMAAAETARSALERALSAVEAHLESISDDGIGCELIAFAFFDSFSPDERERLSPRLGPHSRLLLDGLDLPVAQWWAPSSGRLVGPADGPAGQRNVAG
jgi:hypothetical protein